MSNVTFTWSNLPAGYCWTGPQQYMTDVLSRLIGTLPGGTGIYVGPDLPPAANQGDVWVRTNYDGTMEGIYKYEGYWHRPHPVEPSSPEVMIWKGTEADLWLYQGGDGTDPGTFAPTDFTGAMWQVDTDFEFRVPLGIGHGNVGTNPVDYPPDPATSVAQGATGGDEKIVITPIDHVHCVGRMQSDDAGGEADNVDLLTGTTDVTAGAARGVHGGSDSVHSDDISDDSGEFIVTKPQEKVGGGTPDDINQNNMPPYKAVVFARRTSRKFITVLV